MSDDAHDHEDHAEEHPGARDDEALSYRAKRVLRSRSCSRRRAS